MWIFVCVCVRTSRTKRVGLSHTSNAFKIDGNSSLSNCTSTIAPIIPIIYFQKKKEHDIYRLYDLKKKYLLFL